MPRKLALGLALLVWAVTCGIVGFAQHYPVQSFIEGKLAEAAGNGGVDLRWRTGEYRLPAGTLLRIDGIAWPADSRTWRVEVPGETVVSVSLWGLLRKSGPLAQASVGEGIVVAALTALPGGQYRLDVTLTRLPLEAIEGPHRMLVQSAGTVSGTLTATAFDRTGRRGTYEGALTLDGSLSIQTLMGDPVTLNEVALEFRGAWEDRAATIESATLSSDLASAQAQGRIWPRRRGQPNGEAVVTLKTGLLEERPDLAGLLQQYMRGTRELHWEW